MSDRAKAFVYFVGMGWTPAQAAGIVANLVAESNLNPAAVGDGGQAYGIAQWHSDRQAGFSALMGKSIQESSLEDQLAWVHAELQRTEKAAGDALRACTTATDAGACVSRLYERPADREGEAARRGALAESILTEIEASGAPEITPTTITPPEVPSAPPGPILDVKPRPEPAMGVAELLRLIVPFIPQLANLVKPGSVSSARDAAVATTVLNTVLHATGVSTPEQPAAVNAANVGAAVDKMSANPAMVKTVQQAVLTQPEVMSILEIGAGGIAAARAAAALPPPTPTHWWDMFVSPIVYATTGLFLITLLVTLNMIGYFPFQGWDANTRSNLLFLIVGNSVGAIVGYWFGTTAQSGKKDATIAVAAVGERPPATY